MRPFPGLAHELRQLLRLAAPIAAAQAGIALMGLVDTAVVGRMGASTLGAVGLANALFLGVAIAGIGVMQGFDPLFAQAFGARDLPRVRRLLWQGGWLSLGATLALSLPIAAAPLLLVPAGIEPQVASQAQAFLYWRLPGLLPLFVFVGTRSFLQAAGVVRPLLTATVVGNVANLLLDLLLVYGGASLPWWTGPLRWVPAMGAAGAGAATSLCTVLQLGVLLHAAARAHREAAPGAVPRGPDAADLRKAFALGLPVGLQMAAEVGVFSLVGVLAGRLGSLALAAHQIALSLASFTFCAALGIGNAGSVRVGWAIGARDTPGARRAGLVAFAAGVGIMSVSGLAFWLFPSWLARILTDQEDIVRATLPLLAVGAVFQISDGVQAVGAGVLRGAGDTQFAFLANVVGHYALGLPVAVVLGLSLHRGVIGLWWGLCVGLTAVAAALLWRFVRLSSRDIAPLEPHPPA